MSPKTIPVDNRKAADTPISDDEWKRSAHAHERFKALLETKPRAKARYDAVLGEINRRQATLRRLREARALTQSTVAELLDMDQSEVSRLEHRSDMRLSTLKRFVHATGGEMHIVVSYPDGGPADLSPAPCPAGLAASFDVGDEDAISRPCPTGRCRPSWRSTSPGGT